jgi:hypothetical protein
MKKTLFLTAVLTVTVQTLSARTTVSGTSDYLKPWVTPQRTVLYNVFDEGQKFPLEWGLDVAWISEGNIQRGTRFMLGENVKIIRTSFQPAADMSSGEMSTYQQTCLKNRLTAIKRAKTEGATSFKLMLNSDPADPTGATSGYVDSWFKPNNSFDPDRWATMLDIYRQAYQDAGYEVVSVSPYNEPDYGWGQGTSTDFLNICKSLRTLSTFDDIRICGGNTLNCDQALTWYNVLKNNIDEGNTHQLAGSFDNYAKFFTQVRADGKHATADEVHNTMEAMVGAEYGLQTAIWWGDAGLSRGEFVQACNGDRLAYAEHRSNWTSAAVYRKTDGKIRLFGGTSERQAVATNYRFLTTNEFPVFVDGYGPTYEYVVELPGGKSGSYQNGQTNAEVTRLITYGEDPQPAVEGTFSIVNGYNGKYLSVKDGTFSNGANLVQDSYRKKGTTQQTYQQWDIAQIESTCGDDFSYYVIRNHANSGYLPDVLNWSFDRTNIILYSGDVGNNERWFFDYQGDGWFAIRSAHSNLCLAVTSKTNTAGAVIVQTAFTGELNQLWRLVPAGYQYNKVAPGVPTGLKATAQTASIRLDWKMPADDDLQGVNIYRAKAGEDTYYMIARQVNDSAFIDNTVTDGVEYSYRIKAVDYSQNRSDYTDAVTATSTGTPGIIARYTFENQSTEDLTEQANHAAVYDASFTDGDLDNDSCLSLDGSNDFIQLPQGVANHRSLTIATWIRPRSATSWQRIFDFGNSTDAYMFLATRSSGSKIRFAIKNGGDEQYLDGSTLSLNKWSHVAVTIGDEGVTLYVNGAQVAQSTSITLRPTDVRPYLCYVGRSLFESDPLFKGMLNDFRIYNYALSSEQIAQLAALTSEGIVGDVNADGQVTVADITETAGIILNGNTNNNTQADVNGDGTISTIDITKIANIILNGK